MPHVEHEGGPDENLDQLIKRTKTLGARCMAEALLQIRRVGLQALPLPDVEPSYFSFPTKANVQSFRARGRRLL